MNISDYTIHGLYFSPTQTTKTIVDSIGLTLSPNYKSLDFTLPNHRHHKLRFTHKDLVILGLPVYGGRIPLIVEPYVRGILGHDTPIVIIALYGNRDYDDALLEMKDVVSDNGFIPIAAGAFIGEHSITAQVATKRPDAKDMDLAKSFAKKIEDLLTTLKDGPVTLSVKGQVPYKERKPQSPIGPEIGQGCHLCGTCVATCPSGALTMNQGIQVDPSLCILCCSCLKNCPDQAIHFSGRVPTIAAYLQDNCQLRKEPEWFLATSPN